MKHRMKTATIDLTICKYVYELHQRIEKALGFPDYYGKNLDAFWDCISRECDVDFITIIGSESVAEEIKPVIKDIIDLLKENKEHFAGSARPFDYEILS